MKFVGWIPCVAGELFFSKTQVGLGEADRYSYNLVTTCPKTTAFEKRKVFLTSLVDWQDSKIIQKKNAGLTRVLVRGESDDFTTVTGSVYFVLKGKIRGELRDWLPVANKPSEDKLLDLLDKLTRFSAENTVYKKTKTAEESLNETRNFDAIDNEIESIKKHCKVHKVEFSIQTNGIVFLEYAGLEGFPKTTGRDSETERTVCRQAFHFLKYSFHKHTHHHHHNESLTDIHRSSCGLCILDSLVRDLKRGMVDAKRGKQLPGFKPSGIGEYGKSLISSTVSNMEIFESKLCHQHAEKDTLLNLAGSNGLPSYGVKGQITLLNSLAKSLELQESQENYFHPRSSELDFFSLFARFLIVVNVLLSPFFIYLNIKSESVLSHLKVREATDLVYWEFVVNFFKVFCDQFNKGNMLAISLFVLLISSLSFCFAAAKYDWSRAGFGPYRKSVDWLDSKIVNSRRSLSGWGALCLPRIYFMRIKNHWYGDFALPKFIFRLQRSATGICSLALFGGAFYYYYLALSFTLFR